MLKESKSPAGIVENLLKWTEENKKDQTVIFSNFWNSYVI